MIEGLGIDVVEVERMSKVIDRWGEKFLTRVFTEREREYAANKKRPVEHIAARFAVKEAVAKALTTGWSGGFSWKDVEVSNAESGKPSVVLHGAVAKAVGEGRIHVSLSHTGSVVVAVAMIESDTSVKSR